MAFIRKNKNRSSSFSVQNVSKARGNYKVIKTLGSETTNEEIEFLYQRARQEIEKIEGNRTLFINKDDTKLRSFLIELNNDQIQVIGPELIFGKIFDAIGFNIQRLYLTRST